MSYLPEDFTFDPNSEDALPNMREMYREIVQYTRLVRNQYTPTLEASGANGTVTYTAQTGWYIRHANVVDYWFNVTWSAWAGGAGNMRLILPSKIIDVDTNYFVGEMTSSNVAYANAADTWCKPRGAKDKNYADILSGRHNAAAGFVQAQATGDLFGHIRYWSQEIA